MTNLVDKHCQSTDWFTPLEILAAARELLGDPIPLDPCTTPENPTGASRFYTPASRPCGLAADWGGEPAFVNPPYGRELYSWIEKTASEAARGSPIVFLVAASSRWDQSRWQRLYTPELSTFVMPRGRVKFLDAAGTQQKSPPYPSVLYCYNLSPTNVAIAFQRLPKGATIVQQRLVSG